MKGSAYPSFYRHPRPHFYKKVLIPPFMSFQKSQPPINKGVHTMNQIGLHLKNKIFPKYGICAGTEQTI